MICPVSGSTLHHRKDCPHLTPSDEPRWTKRSDPEGDLWQRLLEAGTDERDPAREEFSRANGLLNAAGRPVTVPCGTCALAPVAVGDTRVRRSLPLHEAVAAADGALWAASVAAAHEQAVAVREAFPLAGWPELPLERYALGHAQSRGSFCHLAEFQTPDLGSIAGGNAGKHIIYMRNTGEWHFDPRYADVDEAWAAVRAGFQEAFRAASEGRVADIDEIEALRSGPALVAKAVHVYYPDLTLPIYSRDHVRHFIRLLSGEAPPRLEPFAAHARLKDLVDDEPLFNNWQPLEIASFLYWWADPRPSQAIVKVATGEAGRHWPDCLDGGYICLGWDDIGDATRFADEKELRGAFQAAYADEYRGHQTTVTRKAGEVWKFSRLQPGDRVVANRGTREILGVGTVTSAGYQWRPERAEFRHTVSVDWDQSYAQELAEPEKRWAVVTVADVPQRLWKAIRQGRAGATGQERHQGSGAAASAEIDSTPTDTPTDPVLLDVADALARKGQAVLFGPPGTGKTYTALRFAHWWLTERLGHLHPAHPAHPAPHAEYGSDEFRAAINALSDPGDRAAAHLTQLTFHPSYGYEDFIEGFRPRHGGSGLDLVMTAGAFKKVCLAAADDPDNPYLLLIDEINRGDLPKILGELITLLERDKRGLEVVLPQSGEPFTVPPNVAVLGTMNTADRSIRLLDSALRRRFAFLELMPDPTVLEGYHVGELHLADLLTELNSRIRGQVGREQQIGHAFFLDRGAPLATESHLATVMRNDLMPLLQEFAYDDYSVLAGFLGTAVVDVDHHTLHDLDDDELVAALYAELQVGTGEPV
ncbi:MULTISPECIES: McrB family protein [unclassified Streptomyces]|uniref:McrB family protein n=1 Tax=unclassified Streptomyces TaxID=2593676 RepID=UPI00278C0C74|nr:MULTISPECIES: AAA family ATPase [unclassified Streptomyces]